MINKTYKTLQWEHAMALAETQQKLYKKEEALALAQKRIPDTVLRDVYWQAICMHRGNMEGIGRGIYLYWDGRKEIIDVAPVLVDIFGDPFLDKTTRKPLVPSSGLLAYCEIDYEVAPFRWAGDLLQLPWEAVVQLLQDIPHHAQAWVAHS